MIISLGVISIDVSHMCLRSSLGKWWADWADSESSLLRQKWSFSLGDQAATTLRSATMHRVDIDHAMLC